MTIRNHHYDVFIAGAGPAGLAAAIALRLRGADVLVADALRPPIDKPCGEGLMPDARGALSQLGIPLDPHHGAEFAGISFVSGPDTVSANFPPTSTKTRGIGIRRTALHTLLLDRAASLGVRFRWNTPVILSHNHAPTLAGEPIACRWLIGADGAASRVRAWAGLDDARLLSRRFGFRAHYRLAPHQSPPTHVEVHWSPIGQAYITPTAPDEICISAMTRHPGLRLADHLASLPTLRDRLASAAPLSTERGCLTLTRSLRRVTRNNIALIGDASGSVDAITGEGLALGFRQALLLGDSLSAGSLALYQAHHARILARPQQMARLLLLLDRHPRLRSRTLEFFAAHPALFRSLLAFHIGESPQRLLLPRLRAAPSCDEPSPLAGPSTHFSESPASD